MEGEILIPSRQGDFDKVCDPGYSNIHNEHLSPTREPTIRNQLYDCALLVGIENGNLKIHWHNLKDLCVPENRGGMGFRDIRIFNKALLAKQVWRIHNGECPLLANILKARYFKHSHVLEARLGYTPSYTWRSLWEILTQRRSLLESWEWPID